MTSEAALFWLIWWRSRCPATSSPHCMKGQELLKVWRSVLSLLDAGWTSDIADTSSYKFWHRRISWASNTLGWWPCGRESDLPKGSHSCPRGFLVSLFELRLIRDISDTGQSGAQSRISCIRRPREVCTWWLSAGAFVPSLCHREAYYFSDRQ